AERRVSVDLQASPGHAGGHIDHARTPSVAHTGFEARKPVLLNIQGRGARWKRNKDSRDRNSLLGPHMRAVYVGFDAPYPAAGLQVVTELTAEDGAAECYGGWSHIEDRDPRKGEPAFVRVGPAPARIEAKIDAGPRRSHGHRRLVDRSGAVHRKL